MFLRRSIHRPSSAIGTPYNYAAGLSLGVAYPLSFPLSDQHVLVSELYENVVPHLGLPWDSDNTAKKSDYEDLQLLSNSCARQPQVNVFVNRFQ